MTNLSPRPRPDREPIPRRFQVPEVRVVMKWPTFEDSRIANPLSQENIERTLDSAWFRLSQAVPIDSTDFWGPTAEFWLEGDGEALDLYRGETGHPMIAIANYRHFKRTFADLLPRLERDGTPTRGALLSMFHEMLGPYDVEAWQTAFQGEGQGAIELLEYHRREAAAKIGPAWLMFWAADTSKKVSGREPLATSLAEAWGNETGRRERARINKAWFSENKRFLTGNTMELKKHSFETVKRSARRIWDEAHGKTAK